MTKIWLSVEFDVVTCSRNKCEITWAIPVIFMKKRRNDHKTFYCPNGHSNYYPQKSQEEILKNQLHHCRISADSLRDRNQTLQYSRRSLKGQITKMKKRMGGNGQN